MFPDFFSFVTEVGIDDHPLKQKDTFSSNRKDLLENVGRL
jgi:hypothetical protein